MIDAAPLIAVVEPESSLRRGRRWQPAPVRSSRPLSLAALLVACVATAATWGSLTLARDAVAEAELPVGGFALGIPLATVLAALLFVPAIASLRRSLAAERLVAADLAEARAGFASARGRAWFTIGYAAALAIALLAVLFLTANSVSVGQTFFYLPLMRDTAPLLLSAFVVNIEIFCIAQVLVLAWGLVVAIGRLAPGPAAAPVRLIATVYVDLFRALPAIISIYLIGFGLPLTGLPLVSSMPPMWLAVMALTVTYGAYVSEVYRAGIESVHWSQTAAARSLGLSHAQTLRYVIVPQAIRRIIPPLLNDFISLQKDTALVSVIGTIDVFNQAKIIASNHFNLSSVTTVAGLFVLITIPQARLVDRLIERDQRRQRGA